MSLQNRTEYFIFTLFVKFANLVGIKKARYAAGMLAFVFFYIIPVRKKVVLSNLSKAFPELSQKEIKKTAYSSYRSFATSIFEILCIPGMREEEVLDLVEFAGTEIVKEKCAQNKGLIFLTAHFGNWELGAISVGLHLKVPISVLVKPQRNEFVSNWLNDMRMTFGNKVIPLGVSVKNIFKEIMDKKIIGIVGDQRGPREGIRVNFFNIKTATYPGTAAVAFRTHAPVVVAIAARQRDNKYKISFRSIDVECFEGSEEEKISQFNQAYMNILEEYIREFPEQWLWMHNIWKY